MEGKPLNDHLQQIIPDAEHFWDLTKPMDIHKIFLQFVTLLSYYDISIQ